MSATAEKSPPQRSLFMCYGMGLFSMGLMDVLLFIVPLWTLYLGASATEVGIVAGARSVVPFILAIHGGVLMDRLGTKRIMAASAVAVIVSAPLYSGLPWVPAVIVLQLITGYATTIAWVGAQTVMAQVCRGDTGYLGTFNFSSRIGTFLAPILMGLLWDFTTPWITFLSVSLWAGALLAFTLLTPEIEDSSDIQAPADGPRPPLGTRLRALAPNPADYVRTFALLAIPAIAISMAGGFLRNTTSAVQGSIYVVYLNEVGLTGTAIGALFAAIEGASAIGSLLAGQSQRVIKPYTLMLTTTGLGIVLINGTPLLGGIFVLLMGAQLLRGVIQGINQPVLFGIQARAAGRARQGATVALRVTLNRLVSIVVPPVMGIIADTAGIEMSFFWLGSVLILMTAGLAVWIRFAPDDGTEAKW